MNEDFLINAIFGSRYKLKSGVEFHTTPPPDSVRPHPESLEQLETYAPDMNLEALYNRMVSLAQRGQGCQCDNCRHDREHFLEWLKAIYHESLKCPVDKDAPKPPWACHGHGGGMFGLRY